jgi:hypothetical protein
LKRRRKKPSQAARATLEPEQITLSTCARCRGAAINVTYIAIVEVLADAREGEPARTVHKRAVLCDDCRREVCQCHSCAWCTELGGEDGIQERCWRRLDRAPGAGPSTPYDGWCEKYRQRRLFPADILKT